MKQETFGIMWDTGAGFEFFKRILPTTVEWTRRPEMATQLTKKHAAEIGQALGQLGYDLSQVQLIKVD